MRAHDRAAIRSVPRFDLTVTRFFNGAALGLPSSVQEVRIEGLSERQLEDEKRFQIEAYPNHDVHFDVERL